VNIPKQLSESKSSELLYYIIMIYQVSVSLNVKYSNDNRCVLCTELQIYTTIV